MVDVTSDQVMRDWATKGVDFEPGTRWQYSNTNYVILGRIVEKASGQPFSRFLRTRVLDKLHLDSAIDVDEAPMGADAPFGYVRHASGPLRQRSPEGKGWMYGAGELAMTASDLARWDIALMEGRILKPASLRAMTTASALKDGTANTYGLGLDVSQMANGHRKWQHTGLAAGFASINTTYPDDRTSITVLTNSESAPQGKLTRELEKLLFADADSHAETALENARKVFTGQQKGSAERALMTDDLSGYLSPAALADFADSLGAMGEVKEFNQVSRSLRGGMEYRSFQLKMSGGKSVRIAAYIKPDGRFDQFLVSERN
jgi:D-alanyl-D-alanine carboxypeptidase